MYIDILEPFWPSMVSWLFEAVRLVGSFASLPCLVCVAHSVCCHNNTYCLSGAFVELNSLHCLWFCLALSWQQPRPGQPPLHQSRLGRAHDRRKAVVSGSRRGGGSFEKPESLSQCLGDRAPCVPVFPPIRPGKADYCTPPPPKLSPSRSLSLSRSPCTPLTRTSSPVLLSTDSRGREKLVILGAVWSHYLTCSFQHLKGKKEAGQRWSSRDLSLNPFDCPSIFDFECCCSSLKLGDCLSPQLRSSH